LPTTLPPNAGASAAKPPVKYSNPMRAPVALSAASHD
jgi:hypothetical protein